MDADAGTDRNKRRGHTYRCTSKQQAKPSRAGATRFLKQRPSIVRRHAICAGKNYGATKPAGVAARCTRFPSQRGTHIASREQGHENMSDWATATWGAENLRSKKMRRLQVVWRLGLGWKQKEKHRDQQGKNGISTPIQPQHLLNKSARPKRFARTG
jgi:hypothetical protein